MQGHRAASPGDLIASSANVYLPQIGMQRKGRSRIWFKDNRWWLTVVEFQPSSWSKGTYLNVAANWLWHAKDHLAFDVFERVEGFADFTDSRDFAIAANKYASRAAKEVQALERKFSTLSSVANHLRSNTEGNPWHHYHAMMASLANGELALARTQQQALSRVQHDVPWCTELKVQAKAILSEAADTASARAVVSREVASARAQLGLSAIEPPEIWLPRDEA